MIKPIATVLAALLLAAGCRGSELSVASSDGTRIVYEVHGSGSPAVVLIHSWGTDRQSWSRQIEVLAERYRTVALDLGGHGSSGDRAIASREALAQDVQAVVQALEDEKVILVGHSLGALVAVDAAVLLGDRVLGIVGVEQFRNAETLAPVNWPDQVAKFEADWANLCPQFTGNMMDPEKSDIEVRRFWIERICSQPPGRVSRILRLFNDYVVTEQLISIGALPVRAINSSHKTTAVDTNRLYAPDFDVVYVDTKGHFPMFEVPDEFNEKLLAVLAELAPSP
jgi:pimeloyl-ACP methyl ester carboxylesterase